MEEQYFQIQGKKPLAGEIDVKGCKNAATPIIAATLLTNQPCYIQNLPLVEDIFRMLDLVKELGAKVDFIGEREVKIEAKDLDPSRIRKELVTMLRSSVFLLGPLLSRFGEVKMPQPGGCLIGARPVDAHLEGFQQLGAEVEREEKYYILKSKYLKSGEVVLPEFSVTATENILMVAALLPGKTVIKIAALEPHVKDLSRVLVEMGAKIRWLEDHTIEIEGRKKLKGFSHFVIYDPVEAGSFIILAAVTKGDIVIKNVPLNNLDLVLQKLKEFGIFLEKIESSKINGGAKLKQFQTLFDVKTKAPKEFLPVQKVQVLPYPGIPTDLQCAFGVLATQNPGETLIHDPLYEGRLRYLDGLNKMGADVSILDPHRAIVRGPSNLKGLPIENYDLRSGAAFIIAGLIAEGETLISNAYQVDRGYEKIEERLQKVGADIKRVKV
ncbi:MAG TPA: UDP-N-acetylglucosamine 1-carboxyvinyltransferase [Candidatus Pacearchaeota archaeon]|nr:UDP-N-acetylglucosamine 1-carboxyvinyltransferase [Candidatus Pacearchaeota archaeon]HOK94104.1 UDP-N-acetylglucosamine 1-carboxyvinyltransferase [Candidatus Pacearchaeota archaeon]HPO75232.1 UDP-N-acetylglucosamine 1-carboxyvinyltransferase [Candidatus Pacearchaeota archaeon]